jgi:hypothetical protein
VTTSPAVRLALGLALASSACSHPSAVADAGEDSAATALDLCDAFTESGAACLLASPVRCFPECESGGCFCRATPEGPRWACDTDLSCVPDCAPIDEECGATGSAVAAIDAGDGGSD